jgi:hypothetical protein
MLRKLIVMAWLGVVFSAHSSFLEIAEQDGLDKDFALACNAVLTNDMDALIKAVDKREGILNESCGGQVSPLFFAVDKLRIDMIKYLLSKGARWDMKFDFGYLPLKIATTFPVAIMDCFIKAGMPVNARFGGDETVLHAAADQGRADMVRYLLRAGASTTMRTTSSNLTAPLIASFGGHIDAVKEFCGHDPRLMGTFFNRGRGQGKLENLSTLAVLGGKKDMLDYLLRNGDSLTWKDYAWDTLSELARARGRGLADTVQKYRARSQKGSEVSRIRAKRQGLRAHGVPLQALELAGIKPASAQLQDQEQQRLEPEQAKKKKKKKKKKKAEQEDDGGPVQASAAERDLALLDAQAGLAGAEQDQVPLEADSGDSTAWQKWSVWEEDIAQAGLGLQYEEQQEQAQERLAQEEQARRDKKYQESQELVHALTSFVRGDKSTYEWPRNLILDRYALVEEHEKEYGQLYNDVYDALFNSSGKQRRVKAAPTSASSAKQSKAKNGGAQKGQKNSGHNNGAGRKANKQEKKSHIPAQWAPSEPLPKPAPSVYDHLMYAAGYVEDDGQPKQQEGDYMPDNLDGQSGESGDSRSSSPQVAADAVRIAPGAASEDMLFYEEARERANYTPEWPHAQNAAQLEDGGAVQAYSDGGEQYPGEFAQYAGELGTQRDSDAKAQLAAPLVRIPLYGGDEVVWHREHAVAINLEHESGLHLDPNNKLELANNLSRHDGPISRERNGCYGLSILGKVQSMFPDSWTVQDLTNRFVHAIQSGNFTPADEQYAAKSGKTKTRTVLVGIMEPGDFLESERPVHFMARMVGNTNMIGTVFPITKNRYQQFAGAGQNSEEKDDQELDLNSWEADAQISGAEQYESIWG